MAQARQLPRQAVRPLTHLVIFLSIAAAGSCGDLSDFTLGVCGNSVLEAGEDCEPGDKNSDPAQQGYCAPKGDPDQCHYLCRDGASCPADEACGVDGVCRAAGEGFVATGTSTQLLARDMHTGDLDGDGRTDVLLTRNDGSLVASFSSGRELNEPSPFPADASEGIAIGRLRADSGDATVPGGGAARERADLVVGSSAALAALLGDAARNPTVDAVPSYNFGSALSILKAPSRAIPPPASLPESLVLKPETEVEGLALQLTSFFYIFLKSPYTADTPIVQDGGTNAKFVADIADLSKSSSLVPLVENRTASCNELLLGHQVDGGGAWVVYFCGTPIETDPAPGPVKVVVPSGVVVTGPPMAVDMVPGPDVASHLDVVIPTSAGLYVAQGDGTAPFLGAVDGVVSAVPCTEALCNELQSDRVFSLADLNDDGLPDAVTDKGVLLSDGTGYYQAAFPALTPWSEAVVADVNADGIPDVIAAPDGGRTGLEVMTGSGSAYFNPTVLSTTRPVTRITAGDFDGDHVDDVVAIEPSPTTGCDSPDDIVTFFGAASGGLVGGVVVGRLAGANQIISGRLPRLDKRDSIYDFGVGSKCDDEDSKISIFYGTGSRQLDAPLLLLDQLTAASSSDSPVVAPYTPAAIALPSGVLAKADPKSIVTATVSSIYAPVLAPGTDPLPANTVLFIEESVPEQIFAVQHLIQLSYQPSEVAKAAIAVGELDGDEGAEIGLWVPSTAGSTLTIVDDWDCVGGTTDTPSTCEGSPLREIPLDPVDPATVTRSQMVVGDVDGDGQDDLLLLVLTDTSSTLTLVTHAPELDPPYRVSTVGAGQVTAASVTLLSPAPSNLTGGVSTTAPAIVFAGSYGGQGGIFGLSLDPKSKSHDPVALTGVEGFSGCDVTCGGRTSISAGDVDGDGLDDLVLLDSDAVQVFYRSSTSAGDAEKKEAK